MFGAGNTHKKFVLPESLNFQQLQREISRNHAVRRETVSDAAYSLFDTFDWRLYRMQQALIREGDRIGLADLELTHPSAQAEWTKPRPPRFWWDLPESDMRHRLQAVLDVRALLPLMSVTRQKRGLWILNQDQKTVLKLYFCTYVAKAVSGSQHTARRIELQPVLGYRRELEEFKRQLAGMDIAVDRESVSVELMRQMGLTPGRYSSKFLLPLDPELPSGEALRRILGHLIDVMILNQAGVKADTDTEFLHDYRVAIRRIRSALGQIKGIFPQDETLRFREAFARLGQTTNTLRDLDVYLLRKEQYRALLPEHLAPGLDALFEDLAAERKNKHRAVARSLNRETYKATVAQWREFLKSPAEAGDEEAPNAQRPVLQLACQFIFKRYQQIIRSGRKIGDDTPDDELHRLRISCKKLRYLLEFFASLFPEEDMAHLVGQLKKLQDNLGDFNDLFVQQQYLEDHLNNLVGNEGKIRQAAAAVGGLITSLNQKQKSVRQNFEKRFRVFSSPQNHALFVRLFKTGPSGGKGR
ncbi:MAG: CHAD domain-containing protein [Candidatus Aminicenantaceae bacterium]